MIQSAVADVVCPASPPKIHMDFLARYSFLLRISYYQSAGSAVAILLALCLQLGSMSGES